MADSPPTAISDISDPDLIRVRLLASGRDIHAPLGAVGTALKAFFDTLYVALTGDQTIAGVKTFSAIPVLSGGAVRFPATQVPSAGANDLDDYEEGTFTPAFSATGATFSYASRTGSYTKIGRLVSFWIDIVLNTSGNTLAANALTITGMPFTASASNGQGIFPVRWSGSTASYIAINVRVLGGATSLVVEGYTASATAAGGAINADAALHATNGSTFRVVGSYFV